MKKKGGTSFHLKDFEGSNFGPLGYSLKGRPGLPQGVIVIPLATGKEILGQKLFPRPF